MVAEFLQCDRCEGPVPAAVAHGDDALVEVSKDAIGSEVRAIGIGPPFHDLSRNRNCGLDSAPTLDLGGETNVEE